MDNKDQKDIPSFNQTNLSNDYKFLFKKLKSIKEIINKLEKNILEKEI
tara:strand:+ start:335 stop:478 length:144 start_codon:yes stop_codon:yes gene_type:complete